MYSHSPAAHYNVIYYIICALPIPADVTGEKVKRKM